MVLKQALEKRSYFAQPSYEVEFIPTGCTVLDCTLGGGWPLGRVANVVGDKSTGKTLLAIEASANFVAKYPDGKIFYNEAEAAFDKSYAEALGLPVANVKFIDDCYTVEELFKSLEESIDSLDNAPGLYILDSLDALSDKAELERDITEGSYAMQKAKKIGELFRRLVKRLHGHRLCVMVISQERDNIGVTFGKSSTRSGGRALDFYASQVLWLHHKRTNKKLIKGVERPVSIEIKAKCEKNKISMPYRECEFPIHFGFGVNDLVANLNFLMAVGEAEKVDAKLVSARSVTMFIKSIEKLDDAEYIKKCQEIKDIVTKVWYDIEKSFLPTRKKYG